MKAVLSVAAAAAAFLACSQPVLAAEPDYLDDRSSAEALVRSLYNAIDRQEYARAWSYFGEAKPAGDFDSFVKGYADTESVEVRTGGVAEEGAAGSIFFTVPVAVLATDKAGEQKVFSGCYTLRQVNDQIQEPPFDPIHIEKGALKPSDKGFEDAVPEQCDEGQPPRKKDAALEKARKAFLASYGEECDKETPEGKPAAEPAVHSIRYSDKDAGQDDAEREARLFRFFCHMAAYNETAYYYLADNAGEVRQLQFAAPELDIRYENDDYEGKVEAVNVTGFQTEDFAINSGYDENSRTITTMSRWRGLGDAFSAGTYLFRNGDFSLVKYEVDASYDEEINPQTVVDYYTAP